MTLVKRLVALSGLKGISNDVLIHKNNEKKYERLIIYFGGDVQHYPEVMESHRDNKRYLQWNLINVASTFSSKFADSIIMVILPNRFEMKTLSCFDGFVPSGKAGEPYHSPMEEAIGHLQALTENALKESSSATCETDEKQIIPTYLEDINQISIIGFSKGCVVLNQIIREMSTIKLVPSSCSTKVKDFVDKFTSMYWLDGGHAGGKETWITSPKVLEDLASYSNIHLYVHVTPYQINCDRRPWIGKECKRFVSLLKKYNATISYNVHFDNDPPTLSKHFQILEIF